VRKFITTLGICLLISASGPAFAAAPDAKTFVSDAISSHNGLVKLGNVGQAKGRTTTQTFAVRMARDYNNANHELEALAGTLGVTPPDGISADVQAEAAKLGRLGDDDFDKEYGTFLVKMLTAEIAEFQAMADAKSGPASGVAAAQLPLLQKTLDGAKRVAR
jgi:predicted outer membrane protein